MIPVLDWGFGTWHLSVAPRPFTPAELSRVYDRVAPVWVRRLARLGVPRAYETLLGRLRDTNAMALPSDARVLDCGIGTGALSLALAAAHTRPLRIEAVDLSRAMLARAARGLAAAGIPTHLYRGDARALPYPANTFDLVMSAHMLEHLPNPVPALREMLRVLKHAAPLLLLVTRRSVLGAWLQFRWRVHRLGECEIRAWLEPSGVTDVTFYSLDGARWLRWMSLACLARKR